MRVRAICEESSMSFEIRRPCGVERATRKGSTMAPETADAIDVTELAELIDDESDIVEGH